MICGTPQKKKKFPWNIFLNRFRTRFWYYRLKKLIFLKLTGFKGFMFFCLIDKVPTEISWIRFWKKKRKNNSNKRKVVFSGQINKVVNKQVPNEKHVLELECGKIVIIEFQIVVFLAVSEQSVIVDPDTCLGCRTCHRRSCGRCDRGLTSLKVMNR